MMTEYRPELPVAHPRGCNWQLLAENSTSDGNHAGNQHATADLKALAISRLAKIRGNQPCNHEATDELPAMQLSAPPEATKVAMVEEGAGSLDWLEWIAQRVPLVKGDREFIWARLATLAPHEREIMANRYVQAWIEEADKALSAMRDENRAWWDGAQRKDAPWPIGPTNAGRRAANKSLLALVRPGGWRHRHDHRQP